MSDEEKTPKTGRGCLIFVILIIGGAAAFVGYGLWSAGGWDGFQREYLYKGSLNKVQQAALDMRPDGIAESQINAAFDEAREAIDDDRINLDALAEALKGFVETYKQGKLTPSNDEMSDFLEELRAAVQRLPDG